MRKLTVSKSYLNSIEWLRFFAAFGIVWFHAENASWKIVGYAGLPIFVIVFCALIVIHFQQSRFLDYAKKRSVRLLIPWIFWSIVFAAMKVGRCFLGGTHSLGTPTWNEFLVGGNIHLWFLPFAFMLSLVLYWMCKLALSSNKTVNVIAASSFLVIISLYTSGSFSKYIALSPPFAQWSFAVSCLPLGFCLGYIYRTMIDISKYLAYGILYTMVVAVCLHIHYLWDNTLLIPYGLGLLLTILALIIPLPYENSGRFLGSLTYGIYLIHPLVMFAVNRVPFLQTPLLTILATFFISALIVYGLRQTRLRVVL